jgi:hypothetical protein
MFIETTINIQIDCLIKLSEAARHTGRSRSGIIMHLMKYVMDIRQEQVRCGTRVRYQERDMDDRWQAMHVKLRPDEYEYLLDLRKLLKMSVSLILSIAVKKFLKHLMQNKNADNYQFKNYMVAKRVINGLTHWTFIWGFPFNIEAYLDETAVNSNFK